MLLQQRLVSLVESKRADDSEQSSVCIQHRDPDMGKMHTVGLLAVCTSSQRDGSCNPQNDTGRDELKHTVPCFLLIVRWCSINRKQQDDILPSTKMDSEL